MCDRISYQIKKGHRKGVEVKDMRIEVIVRKEDETFTINGLIELRLLF